MNNYLQKAWSDPISNVSIQEVRTAILETQQMDDEHCAFWVGVGDEEECILEVSKDLKVIAVFDQDNANAINKQAGDWREIERLYELLLASNLEALRNTMVDVI